MTSDRKGMVIGLEYNLNCPVSGDILKKLHAGDRVRLTGTVYTARDAAHKRFIESLAAGESLPIPLENSAIYYVGPTPEKPGQIIGSAGPTTSGRMDSYTPTLLSRGLKVMIGKGERSAAVVDAMVENGAVYLAATGGAGALLASCVKSLKMICYEDLGCEAVRELQVENMPLMVAIDSYGNNIYKTGRAEYLKSIR